MLGSRLVERADSSCNVCAHSDVECCDCGEPACLPSWCRVGMWSVDAEWAALGLRGEYSCKVACLGVSVCTLEYWVVGYWMASAMGLPEAPVLLSVDSPDEAAGLWTEADGGASIGHSVILLSADEVCV